MRRTRLIGLLLATMLLLVASGCGGNKGSQMGANGETAQSQVQNLKFYFPVQVAGPLSQKMEAMLADFQKTHPDITVELVFSGNYNETFQKALTAHMSGNPPEITVLGATNMWALKEAGAIAPLEDFIAKEGGQQFLGDFYEGFLADGRIDGKIYGLPFQKSTPVLYWNKDAFKEAGLDPEKPPQTWEELREYARKLTVKNGSNVKRWGLEIPGDTWTLNAFVMQNGGKFSNEQGTKTFLDERQAIEALQFMADLANKDGVMPQKRAYADSGQDFVAGQTAMMYNSPGSLAFVRDSAKFSFGVAPLPGSKQRTTPTGGAQLVLFAKVPDAKKQAAWKLMSWLTAKEQTARWMMDTGYVAVRKSAVEVPALKAYLQQHPQAQATIEAAKYAARDESTMHEGPKINQFINTAMEQTLAGKLTAEQALKDVQAQSVPLLARFQ